MAKRLTIKQRLFVDYYIQYRNASKAALLAGYSEKTAASMGTENLQKPVIQAAIEARLRELTLSAEEVLKRLSDQALADIGDFLNDEHFVDIDLEQAKRDGKTHLIKKIKQNTKTTVMPDGSEIENHFLEIELHDPQKALELLGKYYKLFTQRIEIDDSEWRDTAIDLIRRELVTFDEVVDSFGKSLAECLFESAGVEISA